MLVMLCVHCFLCDIDATMSTDPIFIITLGAHAQRGYGSVCLSVCLSVSVTQHLTSPMFVRLTNDTTYLTGNEGQKICALKMLRCKARAVPALYG